MRLHLSRMHFPVTTLGPGQRIGIWFQGCSIRCVGCISLDTWTPERGATTVEAVVEIVSSWLSSADGVTITGGEPFDQPAALAELLAALRRRSAADVLVFTGYAFEAIEGRVREFEGLIDALVSDPFEAAEPQTKRLRGSDNQRLHLFSDLGRQRFGGYERPLDPAERVLEMMVDGDGTAWLAGIPRPGDLRRLADLLARQGNVVAVSEDRRSSREGSS